MKKKLFQISINIDGSLHVSMVGIEIGREKIFQIAFLSNQMKIEMSVFVLVNSPPCVFFKCH